MSRKQVGAREQVPVAISAASSRPPKAMAPGSSAETKLVVTTDYNKNVPLSLHTEKIIVEITGPSSDMVKTANLDLVVVLDTSGSMSGQKLEDMKKAAEMVIRKMGERDSLTLVPFSSKAEKPFQTMWKDKDGAIRFVNDLKADGDTNTKDGLSTAVDFLRDLDDRKKYRSGETGRVAAIFVMSDGIQNIGGDAREVDVRTLPVFTFGFGDEHKDELLHDIARRSHRGVYHVTPHSTVGVNLLRYLEMVLETLRSVSALNLKVTLRPEAESTIVQVDPGNYRVENGKNIGEFIIDFGELARKESRKVIVGIQLPSVLNNVEEMVVMAIQCSYDLPFSSNDGHTAHDIKMARNRNAPLHAPMKDSMASEIARRDHAQRLRKVKNLGDAENYEMALEELKKAKTAALMTDAIIRELQHLEKMLGSSQDEYNTRGSASILAAILAHDRQKSFW